MPDQCHCGKTMAPFDKDHEECWRCRADEAKRRHAKYRLRARSLPMPTDREELLAAVLAAQIDENSKATVHADGRSLSVEEYARDEILCPLGDLQSLLEDLRTMNLEAAEEG